MKIWWLIIRTLMTRNPIRRDWFTQLNNDFQCQIFKVIGWWSGVNLWSTLPFLNILKSFIRFLIKFQLLVHLPWCDQFVPFGNILELDNLEFIPIEATSTNYTNKLWNIVIDSNTLNKLSELFSHKNSFEINISFGGIFLPSTTNVIPYSYRVVNIL